VSLGQEGQARDRHASRRTVLSAHRTQGGLEQKHGDGDCQAEHRRALSNRGGRIFDPMRHSAIHIRGYCQARLRHAEPP